jgi:hypothetical protein
LLELQLSWLSRVLPSTTGFNSLKEPAMNNLPTRHAFALPAALLSILITSTMVLIPTLAAAGATHGARDTHAIQAAAPAAGSSLGNNAVEMRSI